MKAIGSVSEEGNHMLSWPTEKESHDNLAGVLARRKGTALIAATKEAHAEEHSYAVVWRERAAKICNNVTRVARLKYELKAAPVFAYFFT